jgi:glutamyl-Q tRNA(Asp) synthetase
VPGAAQTILSQLAACGLFPDEPPWFQSQRSAAYQQTLDLLNAAGATYPCACSRKDIYSHWLARGQQQSPHAQWPYPGTCRDGLRGLPARAVRLRCGTPEHPLIVHWTDRRLGPQLQNISTEVGDFVLKRADALWAYQLAVVVDDAAQGITHVVRGEDLADNTPRQIHLQRQLGLPTPLYLHTPLVLDAAGEKLSKSSDAPPVTPGLSALQDALRVLALTAQGETLGTLLGAAVKQWQAEHCG